ncbi:hypothetical protein Leryth_018512 [Lithospermum erythrorhizon]|nr:hypothetical protein Leryth_018512 [Lithospermum erythrorhizon]
MEDFMKDLGSKKMPNALPMERKCIVVEGPVIVGAGPSGLATAACLKKKNIPSLILERANCIASLWKLKTYDRLHLHIPKDFCQLPHMPFPENYPTYPNREQFISYLENYVDVFGLEPRFNETVVRAEFDEKCEVWRLVSVGEADDGECVETEYVSKWLVVATGENAEEIVPSFEGMDNFNGPIYHTSAYKNGYLFREKKVLVVGSGNSGMEVCLDLANYNAKPSLVVRDSVHILPREMLGRSTFEVSMFLLKWFPLRLVDFFMLLISYFILGDTSKLGIPRPKVGPLELKMKTGKTPTLDVGTLDKIREDGMVETFDAIILATGFKSNVPSWLKGTNFFSNQDGFPIEQFPNGWKGKDGLYVVGFTKRGLLGASMNAIGSADDIHLHWKNTDDDEDKKLA